MLFGSVFQFGFLTSKPCFSLKSVHVTPRQTHNELVLALPIDVTSGSKVNYAESKTGQVQLLVYINELLSLRVN